jgi:hypothetical protein
MATYIQGVTGYIPQVQAFRPDYNFYNQALQFKQSKYDQAHEQLSNLYGSLLNAPMLRDGNIEARDQFFKTIDQDIQRMSGMDLSLQQNVDAAAGVFNQILENKNIVKDMVWTKNWQNEHQRAEAFRDCIDPEKCGGSWWEGGVKALNYQAEEFKNASDDEALGMGNVRYTPYQDMMSDAIKLAKEAGLSIKMDQLQGGYITTTKNGPQLVGPLSSLFMGKFANDPKYADYYKTKAYVDRKDWVMSNAATYGSVEAAEGAYLTEITNMFKSQMGPAERELESEHTHTEAQRRHLEERIRTEGALPGSPLARQYQQMNQFEGEVKGSYDVVKGANRTMDLASQKGASRAAMAHVDNALAMMYMGKDINGAAEILAYRDYEFSMKPDEYALEGYRQSNRMALESYKHQNRLELEQFKYEIKDQYEQRQAMGSELDNVPQTVTDLEGASVIGDMQALLDNKFGDQGGYKQFMENKGAIENDIVGSEKSMLKEVLNLSINKSKSEGGAGIASKDLLKMGDYMFKELAKQEHFDETGGRGGAKGRANAQQYYKKLATRYNSLDDAGKLKMIQNYDFTTVLESKNLPNNVYSNMYKNMLGPMMDQKNEGNRVNRDYLGNLWQRTADQRKDIAAKESALDQLDKWYASTTQEVIAEVSKHSPDHAALLEHYVNPQTGEIRSAEEFAQSYARANSTGGDPRYDASYQAAYGRAMNLYRGDKQKDPGFWDYVTSVADAVGTTVAGIGGLVWDGLEWILPGEVEEGQVGNVGFDYDSPTDVANWEASGNDGKADQGLHDVWRRAWSKHAKPDGAYHYLGVAGLGSKEVNGIGFANVDPSKYKSSGTMNTMAFLKDAFSAGPNGAKISFGKPGSGLPEASDATAQKILAQIFNDMNTQGNAKNAKRPILSVVYQDIAGGNDKWTALNIKVTNAQYLDQYKGSEKNPGLMRAYQDRLMNQGLTIYLDKDKANNGFRMASQKTSLDRVLDYAGEYEFDSYPEFTQGLKLKRTDGGGYEVSGNVMAGLNEDGTPNWQPHYNPYHSPLSDPNQIVRDYQSLLQEIALGNQSMMSQYNMQHGVKDPAQLR